MQNRGGKTVTFTFPSIFHSTRALATPRVTLSEPSPSRSYLGDLGSCRREKKEERTNRTVLTGGDSRQRTLRKKHAGTGDAGRHTRGEKAVHKRQVLRNIKAAKARCHCKLAISFSMRKPEPLSWRVLSWLSYPRGLVHYKPFPASREPISCV